MKYVHHMMYVLCGSNIALEVLNPPEELVAELLKLQHHILRDYNRKTVLH